MRWLFYWVKMMDLLLTEDWDLLLDINGNIAVCEAPYSIAQQAANEIKLFEGEGWYDQSQGTPHFTKTLGVNSNLGLIRNILLDRVNGVDNVMRSDIDMYIDEQRTLHGNIYITSKNGEMINVIY